MYNRNAAYDFALFEEKKQEEKSKVLRLPKRKAQNKANKRVKLVFATGSIMAVVAAGFMFSIFLNGQVKLTELTEEITQVSKQLEENESIYTQLSMKKEEALSLNVVEQRAKDELKMKKIDASQIEYINVNCKDKAEVKGNGLI